MPKFAGVAVPEIVIVSGGEFVAVMVMLPFKGFDATRCRPPEASRRGSALSCGQRPHFAAGRPDRM